MRSKGNTIRVSGLAVALAAAVTIGASAVTARATLIDVNFQGNTSKYSTVGNGVMTGAAVLGSAGDTWNNLAGTAPDSANLLQSNNSTSGISLATSDSGDYGFTGGSPGNLMDGFLYGTSGTKVILTLNGLPTNSTFELVVYGSDGSTSQADSITTSLTGSTVYTTTGSTSDIYAANANGRAYAVIMGNTGSSTTLTVTAAYNTGATYSIVNGFQLETPAPEPAALALFGSGGLALLLVGRKRGN